jgi:hypothetical protein
MTAVMATRNDDRDDNDDRSRWWWRSRLAGGWRWLRREGLALLVHPGLAFGAIAAAFEKDGTARA